MLNITNIRLGFACNSSALHSIVIIKKPVTDSYDIDPDYPLDFGSLDFVLASPELKTEYLAATLYANVLNILPSSIADIVVQELLGIQKPELGFGEVGYQGLIRLPFDYREKFPHLKFLSKLKDYLNLNDIAIVGTSDNDEYCYEKIEEVGQPVLTSLIRSGPLTKRLVARYDQLYDYFTMFNRNTGARIRLAFHDLPISRSSKPELVDLKITDYCPFNCTFCYQDSKATNQSAQLHAKLSTLASIIQELAELEVFELAIGGGEPTLHPEFDWIISYCVDHHLVPNLTTKNLPFLERADLSSFGSVAFSVANYTEFLGFIEVYDKLSKVKQDKISLNLIAGVVDNTYNIFYECSTRCIPVIILGFKECGRAKSSHFNQQASDELLRQIKALRDLNLFLRIGVDTVFIDQYKKEVQELIETDILFDTVDGAFSCYIDVVNQNLYRDSYSGGLPISLKSNSIELAFQQLELKQ